MKHLYFIFIVVILFITSCSHDSDTYVPEITPVSLIGTTFTDGVFFITIEDATTVSYYTRDSPDIKGKAKYEFYHGIFDVINPYGRRLAAQDVKESYIYYLRGTFTQSGELDCSYLVVGEYEKVQMQGGGEMWKLKKG